jgi:hypothetical protein
VVVVVGGGAVVVVGTVVVVVGTWHFGWFGLRSQKSLGGALEASCAVPNPSGTISTSRRARLTRTSCR